MQRRRIGCSFPVFGICLKGELSFGSQAQLVQTQTNRPHPRRRVMPTWLGHRVAASTPTLFLSWLAAFRSYLGTVFTRTFYTRCLSNRGKGAGRKQDKKEAWASRRKMLFVTKIKEPFLKKIIIYVLYVTFLISDSIYKSQFRTKFQREGKTIIFQFFSFFNASFSNCTPRIRVRIGVRLRECVPRKTLQLAN